MVVTQFCPPPPPPPLSSSSIPGSALEYKNEIMNKIQSRKGLDSVLIKFNVTSLGRGALYILPVYPIPLFFSDKEKESSYQTRITPPLTVNKMVRQWMSTTMSITLRHLMTS